MRTPLQVILSLLALILIFAAFSSISPAGENAQVTELITRLKSPESKVQLEAAAQIAALGSDGRTAIPVIIDRLRNEPLERTAFGDQLLKTLEALGVAAPVLLSKAVEAEDEVLSTHVCLGMLDGALPPEEAQEAIRQLEPILRGGNPESRRGAAGAIGLLGVGNPAASTLLIKATADSNERVAYRAVAGLGHVRPVKPEVVRVLAGLMKGKSAALKYRAVTSLAELGPEAVSALPLLTSYAKHGNGPIAKAAGAAIKSIDGEEPPPASELNLAGGLPAPVVPLLQPLETKPETVSAENTPSVDAAARASLESKDTEPAVPAPVSPPDIPAPSPKPEENKGQKLLNGDRTQELIAKCSSADVKMKLECTKGLRNHDGPLSTEALIALRDLLKESDANLRVQAAITLGMAQASPKEVIPILIETLGSNNLSSTVSATVALGRLNEDAVKPLIAALNDPSPAVRGHAATALGLMDPPPEGVAEAVRTLLADPDADVRTTAQQALTSFGTAAAEEPER